MSNRDWSTRPEPFLSSDIWILRADYDEHFRCFMQRAWEAVQRGCVPLVCQFKGVGMTISSADPVDLLCMLWTIEYNDQRQERLLKEAKDMARRGIVPLPWNGQLTGAASEHAR